MVNQDRIIERFLEYIQIDSETYNERAFADRLIKDLNALGIEDIHEDSTGEIVGSNAGSLIVKVPGNSDKTILFSSHMDTVVPGNGIKPQIEDGIIRSDGTTILGGDDKAGVAAIIELLTVLKEENIPHHNIEIAFTIAEETGLHGSKHLDYENIKATSAFVLDSSNPPGFTVLQGPAQNQIKATFKGRSAHAGLEPEKGVSAIILAAEAISNMKLLRIDEETTANIGYIEGGGPTNIVTDEVKIEAEVRSLNEEKLQAQTNHMVEEIKKVQEAAGIEGEIIVDEAYKAFKISEDSQTAQMVKAACERAGLEFVPGSTGGGSDTNNFNLHGVEAVNLGVGMCGAHTLNEHIAIKDIVDTARLILEIAKV